MATTANTMLAPAAADPAREAKQMRTVVWVVALALVGLIFDGYDLVVYGAVVSTFLRDPSHLGAVTPAIAGQLGSYALFGVLVGALLAGSVGDLLGRRKVMLFAYAWFSIGMAVTAMMSTVATFGLMRFITGLGVGALVATTGALVSEFAPKGKKNLCNAIVYSGVPLGSLMAAGLAILLLEHIGWRGMFWIGALPIVTLLPLAYFKMPESVAWLAARGRMAEARAIAERTGVDIPEPEQPAAQQAASADVGKAGWAGLFSSYALPTLLLGLMSATGLMLVYSLNTWLPELMLRAGFNAKGSLSFLMVLNGGAVLGALLGSKVADRFGAKMVVAACFGIGALAIFMLTLGFQIGLLLAMIAVVGLGTSGTQTLIYGLVANYYRTNVRGAGVAWCAGFGRLGGVGGPMLGGYLAGGGFALETIFYILAGIGVFGGLLTLLVPPAKGKVEVQAVIEPSQKPKEARPGSMYKRVLIAIDAARRDETASTLTRIEQLGLMTGAKVHLLCVQHSHIVPGSISQLSSTGALAAVNDVEAVDPNLVQAMIDRLAAAGVDARGELVSATEHDIADVILQRVQADKVDLLIIEHEYQSGHTLRASVAEQVIRQHPTISILLARPPASA
ncbi:MAG: MFS transporter [Proteobacteria bacterium]|nr:MFS transporter [Pseudomonadota bacterium]